MQCTRPLVFIFSNVDKCSIFVTEHRNDCTYQEIIATVNSNLVQYI